ncbi:MAG: hypothetical protein ABI885_14855 [Gammaproteobacteria bacterium]
MHRWSDVLLYGHGGIVTVVIAVMGSLVMARSPSWRAASPAAVRWLAIAVGLAGITELALSTAYLFSPTYFDHVEPTIAAIALYFRQGQPVYPDLNSYTFHGILYGPLLAELNSMGYVLGHTVFATKVLGWVAAWTSLAIIAITTWRGGRGLPAIAAVASAVCVLVSFGHLLTWNRADPLLLLCATLALATAIRWPDTRGLVVAAFLAGAATALKVHGAFYVAPALYVWAAERPQRSLREWLAAASITVVATVIGATLPLLPSSVSLHAYVEYLKLATAHGLSAGMFAGNCVFLLGLWAPILLAVLAVPRAAVTTWRVGGFMGALLVAELVVTAIASKPGAGSHHMLPFLGYHAWLLLMLFREAGARPDGIGAAPVAAVGLAAILAGMAGSSAAAFWNLLQFDLQIPAQERMRAELMSFAGRYPHGVMGIADGQSYYSTFLRPWLVFAGTRQIEYGALMDLKLSGVSDESLARAFASCEIPFLYFPAGGQPFAMTNHYDQQPLLSESVRGAFSRRYTLAASGQFFDVFACRR